MSLAVLHVFTSFGSFMKVEVMNSNFDLCAANTNEKTLFREQVSSEAEDSINLA